MSSWIKDIYEFRQLRRELLKIYRETPLLDNFEQIYGVKFKVDRAARLYAVVNPRVLMMQRNNTSEIFEYTNSGTSDVEWLKQYIYNGIIGIQGKLADMGLLDALVFDVTQCYINEEPTNSYLLKFTPYNFDTFVNSKRKLNILLSISLTLLLIAGLLIKIFI